MGTRSGQRYSMAVVSLTMLLVVGSSASIISERQELAAGREADANLTKQYKVSTDSAANARVSSIAAPLAKASERSKLNWTFRVLESKEVNAFSVPGFVYVNTALLDKVKGDDDELAAVIAHEVGHTTGRHARNQMEKSLFAGLVGGLLVGSRKVSSDLVNVMGNLAMSGYSRTDEYDADRRAVRYMMAVGREPEALIRFFEKLQQDEGKSKGIGIERYFRSHPPTPDRIKRVRETIAKERAKAR